MKADLDTNGVTVFPQKPGGASLPSHIEKTIARSVRGLRSRKFSVVVSDIMRLAAKEIKGTEYAK